MFNNLTGGSRYWYANRDYGEVDQQLSEAMSAYWINFARSGDPNGSDLPRWDAAKGDRLLLITNDRIASGDDPLAERLDRLAGEGRK